MNAEVGKVDVAISLIPHTYQSLVIKPYIRNKVNVVTTSYTALAMVELSKTIEEAGITVMNEIASTQASITSMRSRRLMKCTSRRQDYISSQLLWRSAAPEASDNPLGYINFRRQRAACC